MFKKNQIVLVDTNVLIEAHRTNCIGYLASYFDIHTVEKVVEETQNGFQNRSPGQTIDEALLKKMLKHVEPITELQRVEFTLSAPGVELDPGELDLLIYAETLPNASNVWFLNSPDRAAIRYAHGRNWLDRLVSLEEMIDHVRQKTAASLKGNFTKDWLSEAKVDLILGRR
ncbi:hypothetical protein IFT74_20340 [Oxalobacteraceae sp. CFBP 8755]|nr:hypothetical protein [Oxalobacteraceae sp. CFBP 8755]